MQTYIALTLLYDKDKIEVADPETGQIRLVESGFVYPGQEIQLDDARAEILLELGHIAPTPAPVAEHEPAPESPRKKR